MERSVSHKLHDHHHILLTLCENGNSVGGYSHVLEVGSRRSTRVAKSTWAAELLAAIQVSERGQAIAGWLREIFQGVNSSDLLEAARQMNLETVVTTQLVTDCRGLFDSVVAMTPGKLLDKGMVLWITWLREAFHKGWLQEVAWVPTESMLCDAGTKWLENPALIWMQMYQHGYWAPYHIPKLDADFVLATGDGRVRLYRADPHWTIPEIEYT